MPPLDRHQQPLRLTRDLAERLRKAAEERGETINQYAKSAIEAKIDADEARRSLHTSEKQARAAKAAPVLGLGIRKPIVAEAPPPRPFADSPTPVVVNVGGAVTPAGSDLIARLAVFVTTGPEYLKDQRLRQAVDMLNPSCQTDAEREDLARRLDAAIAERSGQTKTAATGGRGWSPGDLFKRNVGR
jgi:predicted DNA-binding protein